MGIKSFSKFLEKFAPNSCVELPLETFAGNKIAIDMGMIIYQMLGAATTQIVERLSVMDNKPDDTMIENLAIERIMERIETILKYGITPICVFDGKPHPLKIEIALKNRDKSKAKATENVKELESIFDVDPILRSAEKMEEYIKYRKQIVKPSKEFVTKLEHILQSCGFTTLNPNNFNMLSGDSEALCATLCLEENSYCVAAITKDCDFHVYGGKFAIIDMYPKPIYEFGKKYNKYFVKVRSLDCILQQSGLTFELFRDACILMGTDFNVNVENMGPVRCVQFLRKYGNIQELAKNKDISVVNYNEVLEIFKSSLFKLNLHDLEFKRDVFNDTGKDILNRYDLYRIRYSLENVINDIFKVPSQEETIFNLLEVSSEKSHTPIPVVNPM